MPAKTAIRGFLPPALTPRTAAFTQLDPSQAAIALSEASGRALISVREQKFGALLKSMKNFLKTFGIHHLMYMPTTQLELKINLKKRTEESMVLSQFGSPNFGREASLLATK